MPDDAFSRCDGHHQIVDFSVSSPAAAVREWW
jgi:hypothetical protein